MLRHRIVFFCPLILSILPSIALAQNSWIYPKPDTNPTFHKSDVLDASWTSDLTSPYLTLLCDFDNNQPQINESVQQTGSYLVPLNYGNNEYACHLNLAETVPHGGSLNSPNFNIDPNVENSPTTWNSDSDSGPTTSTESSSISASAAAASATETAVLSTISPVTTPTTAAAPNAAVRTVKETKSPLASSSSSSSPKGNNQHHHPTTTTMIGAIIGAIVAVLVALALATLFYLRRRSSSKRRRQESLPESEIPTRRNKRWPHHELGGGGRSQPEPATAVEVDAGRDHQRGQYEKFGHPVAVPGGGGGGPVSARELDGRGSSVGR